MLRLGCQTGLVVCGLALLVIVATACAASNSQDVEADSGNMATDSEVTTSEDTVTEDTVTEGTVAEDTVPKIVLGQGSPEPAANAPISPTVDDNVEMSGLTFDLFDGDTQTLGHYHGSPLVVNFFAAWCPPCVREMPEFQSVFESLAGRVEFLGLSQDRTDEDALELIASTGVTYDVGRDPDLEVFKATESIAMPTTAFVSAEGQLVDVFAGALDAESLLQHIERTLHVTATQ